jgi:hypothetical protein
MPKKSRGGKRKAPYLSDMHVARVRNAFAHITANKKEYIIYENGKPVSLKEAVRRYKQTEDDKWLLHILTSNLGYFANTLGKVSARYGVDPSDYVYAVYYGLKYALSKCDPERARLSYLASGVYIICVREIDRDLRERKKEVNIDCFTFPDDGDNDVPTGVEQLDKLFADLGIYDVPLYDEDTR